MMRRTARKRSANTITVAAMATLCSAWVIAAVPAAAASSGKFQAFVVAEG